MSDDVRYDVSAVLRVTGGEAFSSDMGKAAGAADGLQESLDKAIGGAHKMAGGLLDLGGRALATAAQIAAIGAAIATAGAGAATVAIGKNLSLLEDKSIQLSSVIAAATEQPFMAARVESEKLFAQFKVDAISSAGETQNFVETAALIAGPILGAGQSMEKLHEITKGVIDIAPALGMEMKQVGSDVSKILQGSAGADIPLFQAMRAIPSLAIPAAEAFNQLAPEKKIEAITKALTNPAFQAGAAMAGDSMKGLISTSQDLLKTAGGLALSPLFGQIKTNLKAITAGAITGLKPGAQLDASFGYLGQTLALRAEQIVGAFKRAFPDALGSASNAVNGFTQIVDAGLGRVVTGVDYLANRWPDIVSGAEKFAGWVSSAADRAEQLVRAIGGGDFAVGLERAALLAGGAKVAPAVATTVSGAAQLGQGVVGAGKWLAGTGAGGAATGAAGEASAAVGEALAGAGGAALAAPVAGFLGFLALTKVSVEHDTLQIFEGLQTRWDRIVEAAEPLQRNLSGLGDSFGLLWDALGRAYNAVEPFIATLGSLYLMPVVAGLQALGVSTEGMIGPLDQLVGIMRLVTNTVTQLVDGFATFVNDHNVSWLLTQLGIARNLSPVDEDANRREIDLGGAPYLAPAIHTARAIAERDKPRPNTTPQKVTVELKWDLGEGNEDAIFVRTRRDVTEMVKNAKGFVRGVPPPSHF